MNRQNTKDYDRIAKAIGYIADRLRRQPTLGEVASHLHLSPFHFQRLFSRWTGVTPKRFLQVLTLEHAKEQLKLAKSRLEVSDSLGLSSGSRLYDHFVQLEAVTPGQYRKEGAGLRIEHAVEQTPFGRAFVAFTPRGVCHFAFMDSEDPDGQFDVLSRSWPNADFHENKTKARALVNSMFGTSVERVFPLSLHVTGTNFQVNVWKALLRIPPGRVASYSQLAEAIGCPRASRAVGGAVGANPVAFLVPCHRVIQQSGAVGGYRWGTTRKRAILAWEAARNER